MDSIVLALFAVLAIYVTSRAAYDRGVEAGIGEGYAYGFDAGHKRGTDEGFDIGWEAGADLADVLAEIGDAAQPDAAPVPAIDSQGITV